MTHQDGEQVELFGSERDLDILDVNTATGQVESHVPDRQSRLVTWRRLAAEVRSHSSEESSARRNGLTR